MRTFGYQPCFVLSALFEARSLEAVNGAVAQFVNGTSWSVGMRNPSSCSLYRT
ncbi:MAG: hypothetical protein KME46_15010 [Brasilonema angustatum HA4187-MV1]|nr:hypothetical protein [Brasilonema angustatum HA4187-MV1]